MSVITKFLSSSPKRENFQGRPAPWFSSVVDCSAPDALNRTTNRLLVLCLVLLFFAPFVVRPGVFSGDEPHYLVVANSLLLDRDLELRDDYAEIERGSGRAGSLYYGVALDHHTVRVDYSTRPPRQIGPWRSKADNAKAPIGEKTVRAVGLPVVLAFVGFLTPFLPLELSAKLFSHIFVIGTAVLIAKSALATGASKEAAFGAGLAIALGSSFWVYANTIFAEPLAGLCVAAAVYSVSSRKHPWVLAISLAAALWIKFQLVPAVAILWMIGWRTIGLRPLLTPFCGWLVACAGLVFFNLHEYGTIRPPMEWNAGSPWNALVHFLTDANGSLLMRNPWAILVIGGAALSWLPGMPRPNVWWWGLVAALCAPAIFWKEYHGGYCYPGRLAMLSLLPAALLFSHLLGSMRPAIRACSIGLLVVSIVTNFAVVLKHPVFTWRGPQAVSKSTK